MNIKIARKLYRAGLTVDEIAEALKLSTTAVRNLLAAEIYDAIECNSDDEGGIVVNEPNKTFARERGDDDHIVVSGKREDSDTNPHPNDDDAVQRRSHSLKPDFESVHHGIGGVLAESTEVDDEDSGLSVVSENNLDRLGLFALASAVRELAGALRSATAGVVIPKGGSDE